MRRPGIEPGSTAWRATMLTITPATPVGNMERIVGENVYYHTFLLTEPMAQRQRFSNPCLGSSDFFVATKSKGRRPSKPEVVGSIPTRGVYCRNPCTKAKGALRKKVVVIGIEPTTDGLLDQRSTN